MKKSIFVLIVFSLVFIFSVKAYAGENLTALNKELHTRFAAMMKKKNSTVTSVADPAKPNKFIVKYIFENAYGLGYEIGAADDEALKDFGNYMISHMNNMFIKGCDMQIEDFRYYLIKNNIVTPSYFDSIRTNLFNTCMLGIMGGDESHTFK